MTALNEASLESRWANWRIRRCMNKWHDISERQTKRIEKLERTDRNPRTLNILLVVLERLERDRWVEMKEGGGER